MSYNWLSLCGRFLSSLVFFLSSGYRDRLKSRDIAFPNGAVVTETSFYQVTIVLRIKNVTKACQYCNNRIIIKYFLL